MQADDTNDAAVACRNRHRDKRLKALLVEFGHELETRVLSRALTNERGLSVFRRPPRETLSTLEDNLAGKMAVRLGSRAENQSVALKQVDKACVDSARLGKQTHDRLEHLFEVER